MKVNNFLIIGNDQKMHECKNHMINKGYEAVIVTEDEVMSKLKEYRNIILPLPTISNDYISGTCLTFDDIIRNISDNQNIFTGNIDLNNCDNCHSYYYNESFLIKNSYLTAQGVLRLILEYVDYGLYDKSVAVIGYGRCGKAISSLLNGIGMNVTVFSRRTDTMNQVYYDGFIPRKITEINDLVDDYNFIVNTVPSNIVSKEGAQKLTADNIYIEIASKPYGININETDFYNFKYILGKSLPGRFFPKSAGINIADTVIEILKEV